jgi:hypothetical protein
MSKNIYRSSMGRPIDMDSMRIKNEQEIAVGNMKVNARGDELGPGGIVVRTRQEVLQEYYKTSQVYTSEKVAERDAALLRGEIPGDAPAPVSDFQTADLPSDILEQDSHMPLDREFVPPPSADQPHLRGSLADAVAKTAAAKVEQKLLTPRSTGVKRI